MTAPLETTLAVGGERRVPVPDAIARDYLLLCLRLDQHAPGLVDGYYGPADLKAAVDQEQLRSPAALADDAAALRARLDAEVEEADRRGWLAVQLRALETQARVLAGDDVPYVELIRRSFDFEPVRRDESVFDDAATGIDRLLPGRGAARRPPRRAGTPAWSSRRNSRSSSSTGWSRSSGSARRRRSGFPTTSRSGSG